jgi:phage tail sheath protein FI
MPEYLTPGVYVEETSFRSRTIEGVATSTFGMTGATEYGPVPYIANGATMLPAPTLVTSFTEYERAFGGLKIADTPCQVALAARAFFLNGGRRLYVARAISFSRLPAPVGGGEAPIDPAGFGRLQMPVAVGGAAATPPVLVWKARWPGSVSSRIKITTQLRRSKNVLVGGQLKGVLAGAAVQVAAAGSAPPADRDAPAANSVRIVRRRPDLTYGYEGAAGAIEAPAPNTVAYHLTFDVTVRLEDRLDVYAGLELDPLRNGQRLSDLHARSIFKVLQAQDPADDLSLVWLDTVTGAAGAAAPSATALAQALISAGTDGAWLTAGTDGDDMDPDTLRGDPADPDNLLKPATGLEALAEVDDIAIVAMPDTTNFDDQNAQDTAVGYLIAHCELQRYRIAVVDPPGESSISEIRTFRSKFDSKYAALYYPWLKIVDPTRRPDPGMPTPLLDIPPSGSVAGIYARSDVERGVHKAPANEVVRGLTRFVTNVTYDRQSVLNPEGINALRFFEGRANRVWGARTMSSDPEWKYVNVRRLFIYLEHSIDRATQWAVFEPNNERLWSSIRQSVEDFLLVVWRTGALLGARSEDAFFVRCDRTTMTQNDIDNGRMICLIGVAPTYPAEFVIFRIGQWTADSPRG